MSTKTIHYCDRCGAERPYNAHLPSISFDTGKHPTYGPPDCGTVKKHLLDLCEDCVTEFDAWLKGTGRRSHDP